MNESVTWGIFSLVWLLIVTRAAYNAGVRRGRAERPPPPPPPLPPRLAQRMAATSVSGALRDGMTVDEVAAALGVTKEKLSESLGGR